MRIEDLASIRDLALFRETANETFEELTGGALLQRFPPRLELIREGALPDFLHVVIEGSVELFAEHKGHETTIDILGPVTTFILAAVIRDEPYLKSARTLTNARILMIPAPSLRNLFSRDAGFARAVVGELATRYRTVVRALKNEKHRTGSERLANWILKMDAEQGGTGSVAISYDKRTLASLLGMTPENLSRSFSNLSKHGIRNSNRGVVIEDRSALIAFSCPTPLIDG